MKFNDFLTEEQIDELSFSQLGAGIKGAVSGFKASSSERQGREHAKKIAARLKHEFMRLVGGGQPATKDNLHNFLSSYGLTIDDTVPEVPQTAPVQGAAANPAQSSNVKEPPVRVEPTLDPETPSASNVPSAPSSVPSSSGGTITPTAKGLVHKANPNNPNLKLAEDTTTLSNSQVDQIIDAVVSKNYSRIVAAQRGLNVDPTAPADPATQTATAPQQEPGPAGNPFSNPNKLIQAWMDYIRAGGDINSKITKLSAMLVRAIKQQGSAMNQKQQDQTPPVQPAAPAAAPAKPAVDLGHPADDNPNIGLGANEGYSKFLGRQL